MSQGTPVKVFMERSERGVWMAHAVAFDIVSSGATQQEAIDSVSACLEAYLDFGMKKGMRLSEMYFAAPPSYWTAPFIEIALPPATSESAIADEMEGARRTKSRTQYATATDAARKD